MKMYQYKLYKDNSFQMSGRTSNEKYITNLIKYKRRGKRYKLKVTKGDLIKENGDFKMMNEESVFNDFKV